MPVLYACCPILQSLFRVTARVEFLVAVEADIGKIRRKFLHVGPSSGGVREHECCIVLAQQIKESWHKKTLVPDLHCVPQFAIAARPQPRSCFQVSVMLTAQSNGGFGVMGEFPEERLHDVRVEFEAWRELPEKGTELLFEREDSGGEEVCERNADVAEPP